MNPILAAGQTKSLDIGALTGPLTITASIICILVIAYGGLLYVTSSGNPQRIERAKRTLRNAVIGLAVVFSAMAMGRLLTHTQGVASQPHPVPAMAVSAQQPAGNGLVDLLIKTISGLLSSIVQVALHPFLQALAFFTDATPLVSSNNAVWRMWTVVLGIADSLLILAIILIGLRIMSSTALGFREVPISASVPRVVFIFVMMNSSIFIIDGLISISNDMIHALYTQLGGGSVWSGLAITIGHAAENNIVLLLLLVALLFFAAMLLVYYVSRLVVLYVGAAISPLVFLLWVVPGFQGFAESAIRSYVISIFVLFIHVVILELAASLLGTTGQGSLMDIMIGIATLCTLLRAQSVMSRFSIGGVNIQQMRHIGGKFISGVSYLGHQASGVSMLSDVKARRLIGKLK